MSSAACCMGVAKKHVCHRNQHRLRGSSWNRIVVCWHSICCHERHTVFIQTGAKTHTHLLHVPCVLFLSDDQWQGSRRVDIDIERPPLKNRRGSCSKKRPWSGKVRCVPRISWQLRGHLFSFWMVQTISRWGFVGAALLLHGFFFSCGKEAEGSDTGEQDTDRANSWRGTCVLFFSCRAYTVLYVLGTAGFRRERVFRCSKRGLRRLEASLWWRIWTCLTTKLHEDLLSQSGPNVSVALSACLSAAAQPRQDIFHRCTQRGGCDSANAIPEVCARVAEFVRKGLTSPSAPPSATGHTVPSGVPADDVVGDGTLDHLFKWSGGSETEMNGGSSVAGEGHGSLDTEQRAWVVEGSSCRLAAASPGTVEEGGLEHEEVRECGANRGEDTPGYPESGAACCGPDGWGVDTGAESRRFEEEAGSLGVRVGGMAEDGFSVWPAMSSEEGGTSDAEDGAVVVALSGWNVNEIELLLQVIEIRNIYYSDVHFWLSSSGSRPFCIHSRNLAVTISRRFVHLPACRVKFQPRQGWRQGLFNFYFMRVVFSLPSTLEL